MSTPTSRPAQNGPRVVKNRIVDSDDEGSSGEIIAISPPKQSGMSGSSFNNPPRPLHPAPVQRSQQNKLPPSPSPAPSTTSTMSSSDYNKLFHRTSAPPVPRPAQTTQQQPNSFQQRPPPQAQNQARPNGQQQYQGPPRPSGAGYTFASQSFREQNPAPPRIPIPIQAPPPQLQQPQQQQPKASLLIRPFPMEMGNGDFMKHIKPGKGFASPKTNPNARQPNGNGQGSSAFHNAAAVGGGHSGRNYFTGQGTSNNPYNLANGYRPSTSIIGPPPANLLGYGNGGGYSNAGKPIIINDTPQRLPGQGQSIPQAQGQGPGGEQFNLDLVKFDPSDYVTSQDPDAEMRELLAGAIGDGEDGEERKEGDDVVEGLAKGMKLMPHQVRGVEWMKGREKGVKRGGILADDMGLGKTVQMIATIVQRLATAAETKSGIKGGTLIIAPNSVMNQWETEVKTKTKPGLLKVCVHHGAKRAKDAKKLEEYHVVITTFSTVSSEWDAHTSHEDSKAADAAGRDDDDSDSDDSESLGSTLGKSGAKKVKKPRKVNKSGHKALFGVNWLRIVVDEAQNIKNRTTKQTKAAVALTGKFRWCLTGTPIQNNVEELFSLFQFLRAAPLNDWTKFKAQIAKPVKDGKTKIAMRRLHIVLKALMLRRTKDAKLANGEKILNLPPRIVKTVACSFDKEERDFYDALEKKTSLTFNKYLKTGTAMSNYTSVLTLLLRMRQACCHPALVTNSIVEDKEAIESKAQDDEDEADDLADALEKLGMKECAMCSAELESATDTHCSDCAKLANKARAISVETGMPPSSAKIRMLIKLLKDVQERSEAERVWYRTEDGVKAKAEGKKWKPEKTIVFSQFTSFLNLVEPFLKQAGVKYVRFDGSMRNDKRQESLNAIKTNPEIRVILISFKAGSTGLNLTCCNNVILLDLWWNPALEDQAFDRAHRLGQDRDVNIYKLTIDETVEDRILKLQDTKRELAAAALSGEAVKNMKLNMNDLMNLFKRSHHDEDED